MKTRTWKALIGDLLSDIYPKMEAMSDAELKSVRRSKALKTETNCWWLTFTFAETLSEIAGNMLRERQRQRKLDRKACSGESPS